MVSLVSRRSKAPAEQTVAVSIVCPAYNESEDIEDAVRKLKRCITDLAGTVEVLLINDGSTDDTVARAVAAIGDDRRFRVLSHKVNYGRGRALRTGIQEARGRIIVTTEGDLSWGEGVVSRMVEALQRDPGLDAVFASPRIGDGHYENVPRSRVFLSGFGNRILRFFYGGKLTMVTGMTRAYRAGVVQGHRFNEDGKEIHLEIAHRLVSLGHNIGEVPAVLAWPKPEDSGSDRGKRTRWTKILRLIRSHLVLGLFQGTAKVFAPSIGLLSLFILFFGSWAVVNFIKGDVSIYLVLLTAVLVILWVTMVTGYFLLYHSMQHQIEIWKSQHMLGRLTRSQGQRQLEPCDYYVEVPTQASSGPNTRLTEEAVLEPETPVDS